MSALLDKLKKNSTIKDASILSDSVFFKKKDIIPTEVPAINIALSGTLTGGLTPGVTMWAGPSKHFKTAFSLLMAKSYLDKYPDAILLFYDSEFGTPQGYFEAFGISLDRVFHTPITNVEQLKFDCAQQMEQLKRGDKCIVIIDSIGNLASKKEVDDAMNENSAADFTRAKQLKSFFRIVTPHLTMKDIPMVVVNHTYMTMEMFSKPVVGGGCMAAGTQILLPSGELINIEDVVVGQLVETMDGPKSVTHVWDPETLVEGTPECYEITFEDGHTIIVSDAHEFLVDGSWVMAADLVSGVDVSVL